MRKKSKQMEYFGETLKNGVTIERKDKRTSITLKNVALENLLNSVNNSILFYSNCQHITSSSSLFRIPEIYVEVDKVQVEIADRERIIFTDSLESRETS